MPADPEDLAMMGRPVLGSALVDRLPGGDRAKLIARTIIDTMGGACTIDDAAQAIGCNRAYVHVLRERLLTAMVTAAEPRPHGPPPKPDPISDPDAAIAAALAAAEARARDAEVACELERCRTELALVLGPRLGLRREKVKKNRTRKR
jgi:hypothetical protein